MNQRGITERELTDGPALQDDRRGTDAAKAELLARIGMALGAQRTEVFAAVDDATRLSLVGWWTALGHEPLRQPDPERSVPVEWFPWSLGNIRPTDYVFVRNAGPLPLQPDSSMRIRDLAMGSSLHLPLRDGLRLVGGVCAYWRDERDDWDDAVVHKVNELGLSALY